MSKRVRKRFNPTKLRILQTKNKLNHHAISYHTADSVCRLVDLRKNRLVEIDIHTYELLANTKHKWTVFMATFARDTKNQVYIKPLEIEAPEPMYQHELADTLNEMHQGIIKNTTRIQLFGAGWLAVPYSKIWNEEEAFKTFQAIGAFNYQRVNETEEGIHIEEVA